MKHATPKHAQTAADFVAEMAYFLGLPRHWIVVGERPAHKSALAEIRHDGQRYYATIYLGRTWRDMTDFERLHALVHEACHMIHRRVETAVRAAEALVHDHEWRPFWDGVNIEIELMVDQLALALVRTDDVKKIWADVKAAQQ